MQYNLCLLRSAQRLMLTAALSALAALGLTFGTSKPALAEFEIQESQVEKGEVELEYRGAVHWGFPKAEREEAEEDGDEEGALEEEEEGEFLRQSHDFEVAIRHHRTDCCFPPRSSTDEPLDQNFALSSVESGAPIRDRRAQG